MKDFNIDLIRKDFPLLNRKFDGVPLTYLDNAATTQKPREVIEIINTYYTTHNANIHRGVHKLSEEATAAYEDGRNTIANFINAENDEIIFTRNATEAINLFAYSWGHKYNKRGDTILLTEMEHHSNIVPWQILVKNKNAKLDYIEIDAEGKLNLEQFEKKLELNPKMVSITHISNVLGTINPIKKMIKEAKQSGAVTLIDGAQSVPHINIDVKDLDCDFLAISGHKMLGPTGIGVLYGRKEKLETMDPFLGGGEMIKEVELYDAKWNDLPWKFEAGTPNIVGGIGLGIAVKYLERIGMKNIMDYEHKLTKYALDILSGIDKIEIYGPKNLNHRSGVISFNVGDIHPHDMATILDEMGIAIRSGHHCAQPVMTKLEIPATSRASFYLYNTYDEIDRLKIGIEKAKEVFKI